MHRKISVWVGVPHTGLSPSLFLGMPSCQHSHIGLGSVSYRWSQEVQPPYQQWHRSLRELSRSILHQSRWQSNIEDLDIVKHTPISYPSGLQPHSSSMSSRGRFQFANCWHLLVDIYPSTKCMQSCQPFHQRRYPWLLHITWNLHPSSVDAPVDIHGRSHSFPFIHPREVFLTWCWVIARSLSSCGTVSLSLPLGVGLTGVGLVHLSHTWWTPAHKGTPASDAMSRSQL